MPTSTTLSLIQSCLKTEIVLLFGVAGGLFLVIGVIYFYLLCIKRHAPVNKDQQLSHNRTFSTKQIIEDQKNEPFSVNPPTFTYQLYGNAPGDTDRGDLQIESGISKGRLGSQDSGRSIDRSRASSIASAFRHFTRSRQSSAINEQDLSTEK